MHADKTGEGVHIHRQDVCGKLTGQSAAQPHLPPFDGHASRPL